MYGGGPCNATLQRRESGDRRYVFTLQTVGCDGDLDVLFAAGEDARSSPVPSHVARVERVRLLPRHDSERRSVDSSSLSIWVERPLTSDVLLANVVMLDASSLAEVTISCERDGLRPSVWYHGFAIQSL